MNFKQFYLGCLAHASYYIGSDGEAAVTELTARAEEVLARADYAEARERSDEPDSVSPPDHPLPPGALPR